MIRLYFDGACTPINPGGVGTWGFVIEENGISDNYLGMGVCENGNPSTNNVAEYYGLIEGLQSLVNLNRTNQNISVFGDSSLVCNMAAGVWGRKNPHKKAPHLIPLLNQVHELILTLSNRGNKISIQWIPREQNNEADRLTKLAYKNYAGKT